jgi:glycosyltransferase involved in cell wall biosynthesis
MNSRLWIITELYYPEGASTGHFLTRIAEGLARDCRVHVLCGQPSYLARGLRAPTWEHRNGVRIQRCAGTTWDRRSLLLRVCNLLSLSLSIFVQSFWRLRARDVALVVTTPPLLPFVVAVACRLKRAKCIVLVHDVYPEVVIASGLIPPAGIIAGVLHDISDRLFQAVDGIIVIGRDMKELILKKLRGRPNPVDVIPHWADLEEVRPIPRSENELMGEILPPGKFVIQYSGNMGRTHGLECLLEAANRLASQEEIHFLFVGSGGKKRLVEEVIRSGGGKNITLLDHQPRHDLSQSLSIGDVAILAFVPGMCGVSVPSRLYNIMAAGKALIAVADEESEVAQVVREERIGWVVSPEHSERLAEVVLEAFSNRKELEEMGLRARVAAIEKCGFDPVLREYRRVLDKARVRRP